MTSASDAPIKHPLDFQRRFPIGAELVRGAGVHFRVWAPRHQTTALVLDPGDETERVVELIGEPNGYFSALVSNVPVGTLYGFRLGNDSKLLPDPASRFQPSCVHGPSQLVDPSSFEWHDQKWPGIELHGQIIYEM